MSPKKKIKLRRARPYMFTPIEVGSPNMRQGFYVVESSMKNARWWENYVGFATDLRAADNIASVFTTNVGGDYYILDEKGKVV